MSLLCFDPKHKVLSIKEKENTLVSRTTIVEISAIIRAEEAISEETLGDRHADLLEEEETIEADLVAGIISHKVQNVTDVKGTDTCPTNVLHRILGRIKLKKNPRTNAQPGKESLKKRLVRQKKPNPWEPGMNTADVRGNKK